ncbi:hypothetical protein [Enterococcus sp. AZ126]|uniref:hypothetical protein n=1 Tax=Enterococcus sp. AZ126 TaxID=2774635 RepID=UPI003F235403
MRKQLKQSMTGIIMFFVLGIFLSIFIAVGETLSIDNLYLKLTLNVIRNLTSYVFVPLFLGIILLLLPEVWKINEKYDN